MTTDACSLHIVEQARAAGDKVVVDLSPLGSALPSRRLPLSRRFGGPHVAIMAPVKVGTRLTLVLLLALTPTVALYTYWSATRSTRTYIDDLKRETRATSRALVPALENDIRAGEWDQIDDVLQRMSVEGTLGALFSPESKPMYTATGFPSGLVPSTDKFSLSASRGFVEYEAAVNGRRWFCRLSPLKQPDQMIIGHLLVAQDWSDIRMDLRARTLGSVAAAIVVVTLIAAIIPLAIRRYISNPLRELSRRVTRLSSGDELSRGIDASWNSNAGSSTRIDLRRSAPSPRASRTRSARQWELYVRAPSICCTASLAVGSIKKVSRSSSSRSTGSRELCECFSTTPATGSRHERRATCAR